MIDADGIMILLIFAITRASESLTDFDMMTIFARSRSSFARNLSALPFSTFASALSITFSSLGTQKCLISAQIRSNAFAARAASSARAAAANAAWRQA